MANWKSYSIDSVLNEIEDEKFVLPSVQRSTPWTENQMELLFDTLLKGDSFGSVMVIDEDKYAQPLFEFRPFSKDGIFAHYKQVQKLQRQQYFVIDGQQRLQSLYMGLKGSYKDKFLYFDLLSNGNKSFEFKFEKGVKQLPKFIDINREREFTDHCWHMAGELYLSLKEKNDELLVASEIFRVLRITSPKKRACIIRNIKAFYINVITAETIGISKVALNKNLSEKENRQRVIEMFQRLNSDTTRAPFYELNCAKVRKINNIMADDRYYDHEPSLVEALISYEKRNYMNLI